MTTALLIALSLSAQIPDGAIQLGAPPALSETIYQGSFSPDGEWLALRGEAPGVDGLVYVVDTKTRSVRREFRLPRLRCGEHLTWTRRGDALACGANSFSTVTGEMTTPRPERADDSLLLVSADSRTVVVYEGRARRVVLYDRGRPHLKAKLQTDDLLALRMQSAMTPDGSMLVVRQTRGVYAYDARSGRHRVLLPDTELKTVKLSHGGRTLAASHSAATVFGRDGRRLRSVTSEQLGTRHTLVSYAAISGDGRTIAIATMGRAHALHVIDVETGEIRRRIPLADLTSQRLGLTLSRTAHYALLAGRSNGSVVYDLRRGEPMAGQDTVTGKVGRHGFAPARSLVAAAVGSGLKIYRTDGTLVQSIPNVNGHLALRFSRDGRRLVAAGPHSASLLEERHGRFALVSQVRVPNPRRIDVADNLETIDVHSGKETRRRLEVATGRTVFTRQDGERAPNIRVLAKVRNWLPIAFPPEVRGGVGTTGRHSRSAQVWNVGARSRIRIGTPWDITHLSLSEDGKWLAVSGATTSYIMPVALLDLPPAVPGGHEDYEEMTLVR